MSYIPPRPYGDDEEARAYQAIWDWLWGPDKMFVDTPTVTFEKRADGKYVASVKLPPKGVSSDPERMNFPDTQDDAFGGLAYPGIKGNVNTWVADRLYRKNDVVHVMEPYPDYPTFTGGDTAVNLHIYFMWTGPASSTTPSPSIDTVNRYSHIDTTKWQIDPDNWWVILSMIPEFLPNATDKDPPDPFPTESLKPYTGAVILPGIGVAGADVHLRFVNGVLFKTTDALTAF